MDNSDRAALLAFAWGRRRMPLSNAGVQLKLDLLSGRGDEALPEAHTCFFSIDLPEYSSEETLRTKLLYAIHNCTAIDNDFNVRDGAPPAARLAPSPPSEKRLTVRGKGRKCRYPCGAPHAVRTLHVDSGVRPRGQATGGCL